MFVYTVRTYQLIVGVEGRRNYAGSKGDVFLYTAIDIASTLYWIGHCHHSHGHHHKASYSGSTGSGGVGASLDITGGAISASNGLAGPVNITGGAQSDSGAAGEVNIAGGDSTGGAGDGGAVSITAGDSVAGAGAAINGVLQIIGEGVFKWENKVFLYGEDCACKKCGEMWAKNGCIHTTSGWEPQEPVCIPNAVWEAVFGKRSKGYTYYPLGI